MLTNNIYCFARDDRVEGGGGGGRTELLFPPYARSFPRRARHVPSQGEGVAETARRFAAGGHCADFAFTFRLIMLLTMWELDWLSSDCTSRSLGQTTRGDASSLLLLVTAARKEWFALSPSSSIMASPSRSQPQSSRGRFCLTATGPRAPPLAAPAPAPAAPAPAPAPAPAAPAPAAASIVLARIRALAAPDVGCFLRTTRASIFRAKLLFFFWRGARSQRGTRTPAGAGFHPRFSRLSWA
jgi:hypothetical protein